MVIVPKTVKTVNTINKSSNKHKIYVIIIILKPGIPTNSRNTQWYYSNINYNSPQSKYELPYVIHTITRVPTAKAAKIT